jgi:hypothetical protein
MVRILMTLDDRSGGQAFRLIYFEHHLETEFPQCRRERKNMNNGSGLVEHVLGRHHDRGRAKPASRPEGIPKAREAISPPASESIGWLGSTSTSA